MSARFLLSSSVAMAFVMFGSVSCLAQGDDIQLTPHVDERVELLSIVFRLAGRPEYNQSRFKVYSADIDGYFARYKDHAVVAMASRLSEENGVAYDAVMDLAVSISSPPMMQPLVPFSAKVPNDRWGKENALQFVKLLNDFYTESHFEKFFAAHAPMYDVAEASFRQLIAQIDLPWFRTFYGQASPKKFEIILGMNNGTVSYGPSVVFPDGREWAFAVIGCRDVDASGAPFFEKKFIATVIHEFSHSFVNPAVERHWGPYADAATVYKSMAAEMQAGAYADAQTMVDESLVRAAVILYYEAHSLPVPDILRQIGRQKSVGFIWIDQLCDLLKEYEAQRSRYSTLASFLPRVQEFYKELAPRIATVESQYHAHCAHVIAIQPFGNHAQGVDAAIAEITVLLDKPVAPGFESIDFRPEGETQLPIQGAPDILPGKSSMRFHVLLKPNQTYGFKFRSSAFLTTDGYSLEPYAVDFKTK